VAAEKSALIADMKISIADYGITADELGFGVPAKAAVKSKSTALKTKAAAMYKNAEGKTWSGGRGPKPQWVKDVAAAGGNIEDYKI
jgi:DNA-binding protein H-NS